MKDKDQKFTVISNKKIVKRFAAVIDSNNSNPTEQIKESKKEIIEENPLILSKDKLVNEKNIILEKSEIIKKSEPEEIKEPTVVKKINKKLNNNIFKF